MLLILGFACVAAVGVSFTSPSWAGPGSPILKVIAAR
jgi:hypothetical protein